MTTTNKPQISVNDLAVLIQILDLGSEKGLFKGPDLKAVGEVRERVIEYIKANTAQGEDKQ